MLSNLLKTNSSLYHRKTPSEYKFYQNTPYRDSVCEARHIWSQVRDNFFEEWLDRICTPSFHFTKDQLIYSMNKRE